MQFELRRPAILLLEDGTVFHGRGCGVQGTATGEICFNTGMTGYQEIFTDPSYKGQIVVTTHVHIGNYGVCENESESDRVQIAGLICKQFMDYPSRQKSESSLQDYFEQQQIVGISDIDTRALVRHIRNKGVMNCIISSATTDVDALRKQLCEVPSMKGLELSSSVSTTKPYFAGNPDAPYRVAVIDLGTKQNIIRCLTERHCYCQVFPMHTPIEEMEAWAPHGYMLSNGPGDPETLTGVIANVKRLVQEGKKIFGICLGHQVLCLAMGVSTYKMFNGHRGINHPIKNLITGKGEITSQNHGFVADEKVLHNHEEVEVTHRHLNDHTVAGIRVRNKPVFSVQYHPEASAGPHDSRYLFDDFVKMLEA
ncbi:MAG: glutamine-hydrolyzing carbamoyl-phosphate synthase small subunit [Candidatus Competibacteraceae bacterium]|nr:glutamine-hydrolyzing carbamoyl-phosphate synthase small subunit [Candidatus Competibacteraceae bacterium]